MMNAVKVSPAYFERPVPIGVMARMLGLEAAAWCVATGAGSFFSVEALAELNSRRRVPYHRSSVSKLVAAGVFKRAEGGWVIIDPLLGLDQGAGELAS